MIHEGVERLPALIEAIQNDQCRFSCIKGHDDQELKNEY
jgi:hypothetical protein